jgi:Fur family ferric uptake transcriptional regulator
MKLTANRIAGIIRSHGYKLTPQRHSVLKVIAATHDHLTPEAIFEKVHQVNPDIGLVTVYRTLDLLSELNLVCRVHALDGCRSYMMRRPTEHHHHLICSRCGRVVDFTSCALEDIEKPLADKTGFMIDGHLLEFYGLCPDCRTVPS